MEIHIDTKKDTDEEIRKTIRFLQSLIGEESNNSVTPPSAPFDLFGGDTSSESAPMNMFGDNDDTPAPMNMFGNDDDAPSDYTPESDGETVEEETIIEIVEY